jgi:hypothetical protein
MHIKEEVREDLNMQAGLQVPYRFCRFHTFDILLSATYSGNICKHHLNGAMLRRIAH